MAFPSPLVYLLSTGSPLPSYISWPQLLFTLAFLLLSLPLIFGLALPLLLPIPRAPLPQEKTYITLQADGQRSPPIRLPCWYDRWEDEVTLARKKRGRAGGQSGEGDGVQIEAPEVMFSLVVPAFNEEDRVEEMLTEAVEVLRDLFPAPGLSHGTSQVESGIVFRATSQLSKGETPISQHHDSGSPQNTRRHNSDTPSQPSGFEIIIVDDGSTDSTISTVLSVLGRLSPPLPPSTVRIIPLASNRGKGGAVTHALRHVRGELCLFADADGATKFSDLRKLLAVVQSEGWTHNLPTNGHTETGMNGKVRSHSNASTSSSKPGIVIGSRAWMTHTPSVTARNPLRNLLMRAFHLLLRMLTPTRTSAIADTQCGFKLFTRASLPLILPRMRCEGWVFDVEMLMRAEKEGVPVREVSVGWREVGGSKLGLVGACWAMGSGVAVLRGWWALGEL